MIVICKMTQCPYHDYKGFCAKPVAVAIDQLGMCNVLWKKGQQRQVRLPYDEFYHKIQINIEDAQVRNIEQEKKEETTAE